MKLSLCTALALLVLASPALADRDHDRDYGRRDHDGWHAAPGPVVGVGLPFFAVGYGVYWLVQRRRKRPNA